MFTNWIDFEIWEYNWCQQCLNAPGCPIKAQLVKEGIAPEVEPVGLGWVCHKIDRKIKWQS